MGPTSKGRREEKKEKSGRKGEAWVERKAGKKEGKSQKAKKRGDRREGKKKRIIERKGREEGRRKKDKREWRSSPNLYF